MIYLAGNKDIHEVLYDADEIDGANSWARFRFVTLTRLSPTIFFNVVLAIIGALQVFDLVFASTGSGAASAGGPANSTMTVVLHMYNTAFKFSRMGRASAMAFILFAIILTATFIQLRALRDRTEG